MARMGADLVQMDDVLCAMADSLMEKVPKPFKPSLKFLDKKLTYKIGGKPPREVFYRKTTTFLTKLPPALPAKACSCQYLCEGDPAVIKCHSCSIYFPTNSALYCQNCFNARHPSYRVPHLFTTIENDESIDHTLKVAHRVAESIRYEQEGLELLKGLQRERINMDYLADDEKADAQIKNYGRRAEALEEKILEIRQRLAVELHGGKQTRKSLIDHQLLQIMHGQSSSSRPSTADKESTPTPITAATVQEELLDVPAAFVVEETEPMVDNLSVDDVQQQPEQNIIPSSLQHESEESQPTIPIQDADEDQNEIPVQKPSSDQDATPPSIIAIVATAASVSLFRTIEAAAIIHRVFRGYIARRAISQLIASRIVKVWSSEMGREYYYDRVNGQSSWTLTKLLRQEHVDTLAYIEEEKTLPKWVCKRDKIRPSSRVDSSTTSIVRVIQGFARCIIARRRIIYRANEVYRRILDPSTGLFYYANVISGETKWEKSSVYLTLEPPVYVDTASDTIAITNGLSSNKSTARSDSYSTPRKHQQPSIDDTDDDNSETLPSILRYSSSKRDQSNSKLMAAGSSSKYESLKRTLSKGQSGMRLDSPLTRTLSSSQSAPNTQQKQGVREMEDNRRRSPRINRLKT